MKTLLAAGISSLVLLAAGMAEAQEAPAPAVTGGAAIKTQYVLSDLVVATDEPVVQAWALLRLGEHCSANGWGSHGLSTRAGAELDLGASCKLTIGPESEVEAVVNRYVLHGIPDITEFTLKFKQGSFDASMSRYLWDSNPDATQVEVGYTLTPTDRLSVRALVTYETGFGMSDIVVGGAEVNYALSERVSLIGAVYTPIHRGVGDTRNTEAVFGLEFNQSF
jgi:hypothetical protein